jgi:OOP family OmpA-OmpF porin
MVLKKKNFFTSNQKLKGTMKITPVSLSIVSTLCVAFLLPGQAFAAENRFYLAADLGGTYAKDVELRSFFGQTTSPDRIIELDPGLRLGIRGGYGITDWLAAEIETGVSANNIESISGPDVVEADGTIANVPFFLNLRLQVPEQYRVAPYIGGGFGIASTILTGDDIEIDGTYFSGDMSDAVFAAQAFAGIRFAINDQMGLSIEYHFMHTEPSSLEADWTFNTSSDRAKLGRTQTHSISVAFDVRF